MKWTSVVIVTGIVGAFALASCKKAGYDTFVGKSRSDEDGPGGSALKANVEVADGDKIITQAVTGQTVTIRPTKDSAYGPVKVDCLNAGLIKINYDAGDAYKQDITRAKGCEADVITHAFATAGDYTITMVVLTADGKTASVQTHLKVIAAPVVVAPVPVAPKPIPAPIGTPIVTNPQPPVGMYPPYAPYPPSSQYDPCDPCQQPQQPAPEPFYRRWRIFQPCSC